MTGTLILVRHGESEWNLKNLFTGWKNPDLTEKGIGEAKSAGQRLKTAGFTADFCFTSALKRAQHTLDLITKYQEVKQAVGLDDVYTVRALTKIDAAN